MKLFDRFSNDVQGIFYAILTCFFAAVIVALVRYLSSDFHAFFIVMVRNFFGLVLFLPQIIKNHNSVFKTKRIDLHILRGLNGTLSMFAWFSAIAILPLSEAVAISFVVPILTTAAAIIFLKEKVKSHVWIATIIGFIGILIIVRPGFKDFTITHIICFFAVVLWVVTNLLVKKMIKTESPKTIVTYMSLIMLIFSIPFAFPYMKPLDFGSLCCFAALGLASNLAHICLSNSYIKTNVSLVQPFDFMRLVFTMIIAYFAFGEIIDFYVVIGSLVILIGVIIMLPKRGSKNSNKSKIFTINS